MRATTTLPLLGLCAAIAWLAASFADQKTADNPNGCKVVEHSKGGASPGSLSTSVTAGGGHVSASTSGGNGVTVYSGNGGTSSSVATASTNGGGTSTMVTSGNGNCTIYVDPGQRQGQR